MSGATGLAIGLENSIHAINHTLSSSGLEVIAGPVSSLVGAVQLLVGGLFGLYLILVILKWKESRDLKRVMNNLSKEIRGLKEIRMQEKEILEALSKKKKHKK